ncbi:MAG: putative lipoic acid-binding regulatory protein [Methylophagaceae bacterium]|jgi:putative lipoic acid-binding regulatory protein
MALDKKEAKLEFPCDYGIKAMGHSHPDFDAIVVSIVRGHVDDIKEGAVTIKQSSGGKFTSVTVDFYATSREQLEAIHRDLISHEAIKYIL